MIVTIASYSLPYSPNHHFVSSTANVPLTPFAPRAPLDPTNTSYSPFSAHHFSSPSSQKLAAYLSITTSTFFFSPGCKNTFSNPCNSFTGRWVGELGAETYSWTISAPATAPVFSTYRLAIRGLSGELMVRSESSKVV